MRCPLSSDRGRPPGRRGGAIRPTLSRPSLAYERELLLRGARRIAGVDEAGRGALAGPVAAAAVVLPTEPRAWFEEVDDSKRLPEAERVRLAALILEDAAVGVAMVSAERIDADGIVPATHSAMQRAVALTGARVDGLLVDGFELPGTAVAEQIALIHGDGVSITIACASIVAKVSRDELMRRLDEQYPGYGLARNKGYGTASHLAALQRLGPSPAHRRTFRGAHPDDEPQ